MLIQQDIYAAGSENRPPMLNKDNYVLWSSRLLCYAKSKTNKKLLVNSIKNGPYVRRMIHEPGDLNSVPPVAESIHEQTDDELSEKEVEVNKLRVERLARIHDPLALMAHSQNSYNYLVFHPDHPSQSTYIQQPLPNNNYILQPSFNTNYMQQPMPNPKDITDSTTAMNMELVLMAKAFKLNYSTPTNNNQRISSNLRNRQISQPGMNMGQDIQMQVVGGNGGNQFRQYAGQIVGKQNRYNTVQNVENQNQNKNGNVVAARAEAVGDLGEIEEVNANYILMANLQQASTSGTKTDKALVYDSDRSVEVNAISSPSHPTSIIEDAFSSNFPDYISASPDYVLASPGKTYSSSSNNSFGLVPIASPTLSLFHDDPYMKVMHAYYAKESPIPPPTIMPPSSMLSPIMPPKRTSTSEAPAMTQAAIRKLVADSITTALEAQATTMANADNTNSNTREREAPVARKYSYKEFMSC
ncbi:hypothetical protein Tco_0931323 [Tanacetum coccineum]